MKILDLFCGAGGFSQGFEQAGYVAKYGFDFDKHALETFNANHSEESEGHFVDLFENDDINKVIKLGRSIDIEGIIGGPPCQGFSLAGPRREDDPRNKLYFSMIKVAKAIKPKFIVIENVPSLVTLYKGKALESILLDLKNIGYHATYKILKASDYGIPQIRRRVFIVAFKYKKDFKKFSFPEKTTPVKPLTVNEALSDLPLLGDSDGSMVQTYTKQPINNYQKIMRRDSKKLFNHQNSKHTKKTKDMLKLIPEGKNAKALPEPFRSEYTYNDALTRLDGNKPSRTIDTGHRTLFHNKENRVPSVREAARIQSFPDKFFFTGSKQKQYRQVGNAVPPMLAQHLALEIKKVLND